MVTPLRYPKLSAVSFLLLLAVVLGALAATGSGPTAGPGQAADSDEQPERSKGDSADARPSKSLGVYVGSDLTEDGSTLVGGFGHEPSSHWIEIVPHQQHPETATTKVGVTEDADIPGELTEIPQAEETFKYITSHYSEFAGFPMPLTNGGLNEHGVAARDIWSPSRSELVEMAEEAAPQTGPNYSDLARAAMERATSAREAVEVVGDLMDEHGYSTYGGNSHLFADEKEGWVFINYAHPDGDLWAAERLGSDEVRVSYPGYILDFPVDHEDHAGFMASDRLVEFAEEKGWWDGEGDTLNLLEVYGEGQFPAEEDDYFYPEFYQGSRHPLEREDEVADMAPVSLEDILAYVRDPRWSTDFQGYGQVAHLRPDAHPELQTLWTAITSAVTTPYVPIPIGAEDVPPEFTQHRYMTKDSASNFLDTDWQHQEATRYATREFKRLLYYTCERPEEFYPDVTGAIEGFEKRLLAERSRIERQAAERYEAGADDEARELVTDNVEDRLLESLDLGMDLTEEVETETRERFGIRMPKGRDQDGETAPATSQHMAEDAWGDMVHCFDDDIHDDLPRAHGAYTDASTAFTDGAEIPDAHRPSVDRATTHGIVSGFEDGSFRPTVSVRRDQMATFIAGTLDAAGVELPDPSEDRFTDVSADSAHDEAVHRLAAAGIVEGGALGLDADSYGPGLSIRRDQMASLLVRAAEFATEQELTSDTQAFDDVSDSNSHFAAVNGAAEAGLAEGLGEGGYRPALDVRRDQTTTFAVRLLDHLQDTEGPS